MQPARGRRERPALHQKRDQDHDEGDVEIDRGIGDADEERNRGEEDADRAAQPDPGDENLLPPREAERREAQEHRERTRHQHQHRRHRERLPQVIGQPMRPRQKAEQHEHHDLRQPGDRVEKHHHSVVRPGRPVADHHTGEVDGEKAGAVHRLGETEDRQRPGDDERCMHALRQGDPVERPHDQPAAGDTDDGAEHGFAAELHQDGSDARLAARDDLDQHDGEEDRERIVGAGFDFECGADARPQAKTSGMDQEKHRRRVGRADHRADQKRFDPAHAQRVFRNRRGDRRGEHDANGRKRHRWRQHRADMLETGPQAAVEQNQRQRHRASEISGAHIVELDAAGTLFPRQNTEQQEDQQQGCAESQRHQARQDAGHDEHRPEQDRNADGIERGHGGSGKSGETLLNP